MKLLNVGKSFKGPAIDIFVEKFSEEFDRDWLPLNPASNHHFAMQTILSLVPIILYPLFDGDDVEVYSWRLDPGVGSRTTPLQLLTMDLDVSKNSSIGPIYVQDEMPGF